LLTDHQLKSKVDALWGRFLKPRTRFGACFINAYVYILSNKYRTTFYIGSTVDLRRRLTEHRRGKGDGFTSRYNLTQLVYFEELPTIHEAKARAKQLKNWHREWKVNLIKGKEP
jgi:putative endonuclease